MVANAQGLGTTTICGVLGRLFAFATSSWIPYRLRHVLLLSCCLVVVVYIWLVAVFGIAMAQK
jgi:hypothetical protein